MTKTYTQTTTQITQEEAIIVDESYITKYTVKLIKSSCQTQRNS